MTTVTQAPERADGPDLVVIDDGPDTGTRWRRLRRRLIAAPTPDSTVTAVAVRTLLGLSLLAAWVLAYAFAFSGIQEGRNQRVLYAELRQQLAEATAPLGGSIQPGSPLLVLDAPSVGIHHVVVVEGTTSSDLVNGPGHLASTPLPGQAGVSVLFGRSVTFGAPFRQITGLRPGTLIRVTTGQGEFAYRVDRVRHPGDPLPVPLTTGQSRLTLVAAVASGWRSGWAPQQSVYVDASLSSGTVQPAPGGRPGLVPVAAEPMQGDSTALVGLVLWLQALLCVSVLAAFGRSRWGRWQTWLVAMPLLLACLWGATQSAVALLPNLI